MQEWATEIGQAEGDYEFSAGYLNIIGCLNSAFRIQHPVQSLNPHAGKFRLNDLQARPDRNPIIQPCRINQELI